MKGTMPGAEQHVRKPHWRGRRLQWLTLFTAGLQHRLDVLAVIITTTVAYMSVFLSQTPDQCLKETLHTLTHQWAERGLWNVQAFLSKQLGIWEKYFRQRIQRSPNKGREGLSSGSKNKARLPQHPWTNVWACRNDVSSVCHRSKPNPGVRAPAPTIKKVGMLKRSSILALGRQRLVDPWESLSSHCRQSRWDTMPQKLW